MSSPLLRELLNTCRQAGGITQRLIKQNAQNAGNIYRQYGPKCALTTYAICGVPTGLYMGHHTYQYITEETHYHKPDLADFVVGSMAGAGVGVVATAIWPVAFMGAIGHYRYQRKKKTSKSSD